jgi:iron complex outermembrane receptor protein
VRRCRTAAGALFNLTGWSVLMSRRLPGILAALAVAFTSAVALAQDFSADLTGIVRDSSGGAVPGASVRVVNEATETALDSITDGRGTFETPALPAGEYRVEVSLDGFETSVRRVPLLRGQHGSIEVVLSPSRLTDTVVVTARRVEEVAQEVPIPVSVIRGDLVADAGAFNVNRLKEMIPTVQFYSTNPRNSSINIRGLGAPFGLTNDGIEPGVGLYIDGVFFARPAAATLDFLDVEQVEVLRGPQGTLFGKNTTAGAINVTTRKPSFTPGSEVELNYGTFGYVQAKASVTGPLLNRFAARASFSGTQRDGVLTNTRTGDDVNDLNNLGLRGQILIAASDRVAITVAIDHTRQHPKGYTQVVAGVAPTLRAADRQYDAIAADLRYTPPSLNAFDRLTDVDTPIRSYQSLGGTALNLDWTIGKGRLTSTTARRYWDWKPANDRDFIGLPVTSVSAAPSYQTQWTQELRYTGGLSPQATIVAGGFVFHQGIDSDPSFKQEQGAAAARFLLAPTAAAATPGLLDGYGFEQFLRYRNTSAALFGQLEWSFSDRLRVLPGLRLNYDQKDVDFDQRVYGGLQTTDAALVALQRSVLAPQSYTANVDDTNLSGQISVAYQVTEPVNTYATYATSFKSVGLNLNGVPTDAQDQPVLSAATVKPEDVRHYEAGIKTTPFRGVTANITVFDTEIRDFQAQVVNAGVGVLRGYLANANKVRVRGLELDGSVNVARNFSVYTAAALTDGKYISFPDAPPPLEETGGPQVKDVSGSNLPGISKVAFSLGGEHVTPGAVLGRSGEFFGAFDFSYRSAFSSSASASRYLIVDGYSLVNARVGFRSANGWTVSLWARNLFNRNYYDLLSAVPGNSGLYVGQPGDPRTVGLTLRIALRTS